MQRANEQTGLVKLGDSGLVLEDQAQDIRGLDAYDESGEEIGTVEDLYADENEKKVRFLDVGAGGFLGLGERHFLIPVEAVREVDEDGVTIEQSREKISGSPAYEPGVVPQPDFQREVYDYYRYPPYPWGV